MKPFKMFLVLLAALPAFLIGCKDKAQKDAAHVSFKLTDAPADFDALYIDVQGIEVHTEASGWVMLHSSAGSINILQYVNGSATVVAEGDLPQGHVDQIRLVLGNGNSIVVNGQSQAIAFSGSAASGLTISADNNIQAGNSYSWTIDFDAAQSVVSSGGSFSLEPSLRLIVDAASSGSAQAGGSGSVNGGITVGGGAGGSGSVTVNGDLAGNISGNINPASGMASVCISGSDGQSVCTITSLNGNFSIQAIAAGNYTVEIDPMLPLLSTKVISNVSVQAGQTTNLGLVVL